MSPPGKPRYFPTVAAFEAWFDGNHETAAELWVGFRKVATGKASIRWGEAVDVALCFGWIDGVRYRVDDAAYVIRFTPRQPRSLWSAVNRRKMAALLAANRVRPAGIAAYERRDPAKDDRYSYERELAALDPAEERRFRRSKAAWTFFQQQPPGYRRIVLHWISSARQPATRSRRLAVAIADSARGWRIKSQRRPNDPGYGRD
ncbi:MAG: YdeI family protein [Gemmatimonadales bacterium]